MGKGRAKGRRRRDPEEHEPRRGSRKKTFEDERGEPVERGGTTWVRENIQFIVIGVAIVTLILAVILISVLTPDEPPDDDPPVNKDGWQDMRAFQTYLGNTQYDYRVIPDTSQINSKASGDESSSLLIIMGVEEEFSGKDIVAILDFLADGGSVIICDDGNHTNKLTGDWEITLDGAQVIQSDGWFYNLSFIPTKAVVGDFEYEIMFNAPTGLTSISDADIIAQARNQGTTVIDNNGNFVQDMSDSWSPEIPFIIRHKQGPGTLVIISDTGMFTDKLYTDTRWENQQFTTKLISSLIPEDGHIYYDHSKQVTTTSGHVVLP